MYALASQPQSIGKILDSGVKLYVAGFKKFIILSLIGGVAGVLPQLIGFAPFDPGNPAAGPDLNTIFTYIGVSAVLGILVSITAYIAVIYRLGGVAAGHETTMGESIAFGLKRLIPLFFSSILYTLAVLIGLVLLIIPGLLVMVTLSFFAIAMVLDGEGPWKSLKRSHNLAWGNWWRIVILYTVPLVIITVLSFAIMGVFGTALGLSMPDDPANYEFAIRMQTYLYLIVGFTNGLTYPLLYTIMITLYHDLKLRKEGGDIAARMASASATT